MVAALTFEVDETASAAFMEDVYELVWAMFAPAIAAVMLVAGELYLVTRPEPGPPPSLSPPSIAAPPTVTSSAPRSVPSAPDHTRRRLHRRHRSAARETCDHRPHHPPNCGTNGCRLGVG